MPPRKKQAVAAAAAPITIPSDSDGVELDAPSKRSTRKRKQINYKEPTENDVDIIEAPNKRPKVSARTKVTAPAPAPVRSAAVEEVEARPKTVSKPKAAKRSKVRDDVIEYDSDGEEMRKRDYEPEPSTKFLGNKDRALNQPLMFIDRNRCDTDAAPRETFTIAGNSGSDYTVEIRHVPKCSCMNFSMNRSPCKHMIYTMLQVLKLSPDSPLLYQKALTSTELQSIFDNAPAAPHILVGEEEAAEADPNRKPIEGECPICYMEFEEGTERITYCRSHCGNNMHKQCMDAWLASQRRTYGKGTCPYCRQDWVG